MTSPTQKILARLAQIRADAYNAHAEICNLASGKRKFEMSIPVNMKTDSDMVLQKPIDEVLWLTEAVKELSQALEYYQRFSTLPEEIQLKERIGGGRAYTALAKVAGDLKL